MNVQQPLAPVPEALLALLQLADSAAPVGGYAHSYGLEGLAQQGALADGQAVRQVLNNTLRCSLATADLVGVIQAHRAARAADLERLARLDVLFSAQKLAREAREASLGLGRRLLANAANLTDAPLVADYRARVQAAGGRFAGHHCVAFGVVACALGIGEQESALAFAYGTIAAALSAALRLGVLGQGEAQLVLRERWPLLAASAQRARGLGLDDVVSFAPALEIAMMAHERAYSRLFAS